MKKRFSHLLCLLFGLMVLATTANAAEVRYQPCQFGSDLPPGKPGGFRLDTDVGDGVFPIAAFPPKGNPNGFQAELQSPVTDKSPCHLTLEDEHRNRHICC